MKKEIFNAYRKIILNIITIFFVIILIFYLIQCQMSQCLDSYYKVGTLSLVGVLICYYIGYRLCSKIEEKSPRKYKIFLFIVSFLIYIIWGIFARTPAVSDYEVLINGAKFMAEGKFAILSFDTRNYFYFYNFQTGFVTYLAGIIKLFGDRLFFMKLAEIVVMSITNVFVYNIASQIYSRKCGVIASMTYALLLFNIAGSSIINNQHISTLFMVIALWLFLKDKKVLNIFVGIFTGVAIILRPSVSIFAIALVCFKLWNLLESNFKNVKREIFMICILVVSIFVTIKGYDAIMISLKQVPNSAITGNAKNFKILLGLKGSGLYNIETQTAEKTQVYFDLEKLNFDYKKYDDECIKYVKNSIASNPRAVLRFINDKMTYFCGAADNQLGYAWEYISNSKVCVFVNYYGYVQYILLLLLSLISSLMIIKKNNGIEDDRKKEKFSEILKILFIGFFLVHIVIEVQTRYRYEQYLVLSILSSPVLTCMFNKLAEIFVKNRKKKIEITF